MKRDHKRQIEPRAVWQSIAGTVSEMAVDKTESAFAELSKERWAQPRDAINQRLESPGPSALRSKTMHRREWKPFGIQPFAREDFSDITPVMPNLIVDERLRVREESRREDCDFRAARGSSGRPTGVAGRQRHVL